jgi:hypothetical protein
MDADEIVPLTREALRNLLASRLQTGQAAEELARRRLPRWPFPGAVELWVADPGGPDKHIIATLHDLSEGGVGVRCDVTVAAGTTLPIAVHQPEISFHGHAMVRHCTPRGRGYLLGLEFQFG